MARQVLVEYTKTVQSHTNPADEQPTSIEEGARWYVDAVSAKSLVDRGVAKLVGDADAKKAAKAAAKAAEEPPAAESSANV